MTQIISIKDTASNKAVNYYPIDIIDIHKLGLMYLNDFLDSDYEKALKYFELGVQMGHPESMRYAAHIYKNGYGVPVNISLAIKYLEMAIKKGDNLSLIELGSIYLISDSEVTDYNKAKECFELALTKKEYGANLELGLIFGLGLCDEEDKQKARAYIKLAADKGNAIAKFLTEHPEIL